MVNFNMIGKNACKMLLGAVFMGGSAFRLTQVYQAGSALGFSASLVIAKDQEVSKMVFVILSCSIAGIAAAIFYFMGWTSNSTARFLTSITIGMISGVALMHAAKQGNRAAAYLVTGCTVSVLAIGFFIGNDQFLQGIKGIINAFG